MLGRLFVIACAIFSIGATTQLPSAPPQANARGPYWLIPVDVSKATGPVPDICSLVRQRRPSDRVNGLYVIVKIIDNCSQFDSQR